ncbi:MAG: ribosome assembly RNA-binding protein YhbY [Clostridia bacterium]|jgi:RNA-binding protein|nr:ribosome assembly RNA-binding protein YhbY [Clostridia bacterium]MCX4366567.1 ribosome assembly RNA-binding protein YhbY [Clostridia bacterium]
MTSKERAFLRGLAMNIDPLVHIGKNGISDNLIKQIDDILEAKEIVKIAVLQNSEYTAKELIDTIAKAVNAEAVQAVGSKITLYRVSKKKDVKHIMPNTFV